MRINSALYSESTMEDNSSQNHNGQLGSGSGVNTGNKQNGDNNSKLQYSMPGVLHFIQHEWAKFEMERSQWEVDKAELQVSICFLVLSMYPVAFKVPSTIFTPILLACIFLFDVRQSDGCKRHVCFERTGDALCLLCARMSASPNIK